MANSVGAQHAFEQSQQEIEAGEVEIVDSGRVIDDLDEALMQIGDATESSEQHDDYVDTVHVVEGKQDDGTAEPETGLHMSVSEEVIVETEESNQGIGPAPGSDGGEMEECMNDVSGMYSGDEDESDLFADRDVDQVIRDPLTGEISLTMDLEDLVSRTITFDNGERIILCFSKRCRPQIAWNGHLYVAASDLNEFTYTKWRCVNEGCPGALRTSPGLTELRSSGHHHLVTCKPDDLQVRLRIVIYDLRLMAEFTDDPLEDLYSHFVDKLAVENPDVLALFPPLEALDKRLTKHREYKIYRRRFEYEKIMAERRRGLQSKDYSIIRRQRPFPPSVCIECGISIVTDADTTSQENFVDHVSQDHQREATCQYYSFNGVHLFEQWMRELQQRSRYKIRRFAMHNESLFFLCAADDRWCRAYGVNSDGLHCTAFVRVYDYRRVSRQEIQVLRIQYCLDHNFHSDEDATVDAPFTPDVFIHEVEERRLRTAGMVKSHAQRARLIRRRCEMGSEMMPEGGRAWSEEGGRGDDPNLQETEVYSSDTVKRPLPTEAVQNEGITEVGEGQSQERGEREEEAGQLGERDEDYGIEGTEETVDQEMQSEGETIVSKFRRAPLQRPKYMGSRYPQQLGAQHSPFGKGVKSEYDEKREVATLVDQCNRRENRSLRPNGSESMEGSGGGSSGQPHYVTHRSNFSSYTLYNLVMQIELQCELFKERAQSLKQIGAAKRYLKYLTSLCDNIATDPDCNKTAEELATETFDLKEITNSGIVVTKQTRNLPVLNFGSSDEGNFLQQRNGKSDSEAQPLIFLPVVPTGTSPEDFSRPDDDDDNEVEMEAVEQSETTDTQLSVRRSKRVKDKEEPDTAIEIKKVKGKSTITTPTKSDTTVREPYQTRRSRGVLKPNTKGAFDKATYVAGVEAAPTEGDEPAKSLESQGAYTLKRIPFSGQSSKVKLAGHTMQLSAETEEVTGKPMTLKTATGNLVTVVRRLDGRLIMVSPEAPAQKEAKTPVVEETHRETRSRSAKNAASGKKALRQEPSKEEEVAKESKISRVTRAERRSVYSKYLKKDKDRRDEKNALASSLEKRREKDAEAEDMGREKVESSKTEVGQERESYSKRGSRKQLSENDVIVMDDETFLAVVEDMSMQSPVDHGHEYEIRRSRRRKQDEEEPAGSAPDVASPSREETRE